MNQQFQEETNAYLEAYRQNPAETMSRIPPKRDATGSSGTPAPSLFSEQAIANRDYVEARKDYREKLYMIEDVAPDRAPYQPNDRASDLVDDLMYSGLESMESNNLTAVALDVSPWSDDYWPIYAGVLGKRYADPNFPHSVDWKENFDYVNSHPASAILANGDPATINALSPSEKYDAVIGDSSGTLTKSMWDQGKIYYDNYGSVETWFGICHGWAPAAYMLERPTGTATVIAANDAPITFYPSDIKALGSLLWAEVRSATRFIGGRCNDKDPKIDPVSGRNISIDCFDTNPGSWHLAVVNQIGASNRSMVMDATYDYEVWNQPVKGYEYHYFNPQEGSATNSLAEAKIALNDYVDDPFRQWRSDDAVDVVGIAMRVSYMVETGPSHQSTDSADDDKAYTVDYRYDLEIDSADRIIGGEWYNNLHPDFLWTPFKGYKIQTEYDSSASGDWESDQPLAASWKNAAISAAQTHEAPLPKIVERLIEFSRA